MARRYLTLSMQCPLLQVNSSLKMQVERVRVEVLASLWQPAFIMSWSLAMGTPACSGPSRCRTAAGVHVLSPMEPTMLAAAHTGFP